MKKLIALFAVVSLVSFNVFAGVGEKSQECSSAKNIASTSVDKSAQSGSDSAPETASSASEL